jgi:hypothetical protein
MSAWYGFFIGGELGIQATVVVTDTPPPLCRFTLKY